MTSVTFGLPGEQNSWSFSPAKSATFTSQALHNNSATVAADIARRIEGQAMPGANQPQPADASGQGQPSAATIDIKALEKAFEGFFNSLVDKFGVDVGAVSQALIYKRIGEEEITEETLADGLLDTLKFIDKQFGPEAGDEMIALVNKGLNKELNAYFDNGKNEEFVVSVNGEISGAGAAAAAIGEFMEARSGEMSGGGLMDILKQLAKEMEEELQKKMQEAQAETASLADAAELVKELGAYAAQTAPGDLAPGLILDQAV